VRFRPAFEDWKARLIILFSDALPVETVIDLLHRAGNGGLGEWRPERDGSFGTFIISRSIVDKKEIEAVRKACRPPLKPLVIPPWAMNAEISDDLLRRIGKNEEEEDE